MNFVRLRRDFGQRGPSASMGPENPYREAHPVRPPFCTSPVGPAAPHAPTDTQETLAIMFASDAIMTE